MNEANTKKNKTTRKSVSVSTKKLVLHEAGYKCANPTCRTLLTIEIHHTDSVATGGSNNADNLIALCPNCHTLHHSGNIPLDSLKTWKLLLLSLNEGFDRASVDFLLVLDRPDTRELSVSGDGFIRMAGLYTGGYLSVIGAGDHTDLATFGGMKTYRLRLSSKGESFVKAWKQGNLRDAIEQS